MEPPPLSTSGHTAAVLDEPPQLPAAVRPITIQDVVRLKEAVLSRRPAFCDTLKRHGQQNLHDYVQSYAGSAAPPPNVERAAEFISVVSDLTTEQLGPVVGASVAKQLRKYYFLSTTDHFGPIHNPWVLSYNLMQSAVCEENPDPDFKNIINLGCASISFNNFSFPRGLTFTGRSAGKSALHRIAFLPTNSVRDCSLYGFRPYTKENIENAESLLQKRIRAGEVDAEAGGTAVSLLRKIYLAPDVLACRTFANQVTKTNFALWKEITRNSDQNLNFVYIEHERVVARLIQKFHLNRASSIIHRILFDRAVVEKFVQCFDGLPEAFSTAGKLGTYLFWYMPEQGKRERLLRENDHLVTEDGSIRIPINPQEIALRLERGELMPAVLLTFLVTAFYYGVRCFGGMGQISYLPMLKKAYLDFASQINDEEGRAVCSELETQKLGGEFTIAFLEYVNGDLLPATSLDLLLYGDSTTFTRIAEHAREISLSDCLDCTLGDEYPMLFSQAERHPRLFSIKPRDISKILQATGRLRPSLSMRRQSTTLFSSPKFSFLPTRTLRLPQVQMA